MKSDVLSGTEIHFAQNCTLYTQSTLLEISKIRNKIQIEKSFFPFKKSVENFN